MHTLELSLQFLSRINIHASASIRNFIMHNSNQTVLYLVVPSVFIGSTRALGLADCVSGAKNFYVSVDARSVCGSLPSCFYWPTTRYHVCNLSVTGRKWKWLFCLLLMFLSEFCSTMFFFQIRLEWHCYWALKMDFVFNHRLLDTCHEWNGRTDRNLTNRAL